ncbi:MAG: hypothetical protein IJ298_05625 [Ruminococcus sp.]|nr:hypothetical protein [Ruminococcus sp.]
MALFAIDSIREAELQSHRQIESAQLNSEFALSEAKKKAEEIVASAEETACVRLENASERAKKDSEEIVVTAVNSAILRADELRKSAELRQQALDNAILNLIVLL